MNDFFFFCLFKNFWLEDNCFTILCWFLPYINMNWPKVYVCLLPHTHPTPRGCPMCIILNGCICSRSLLELWSDSVYKPYKKTSVIPLYAHYFQNNVPLAWLPTIYMGYSFRKTFNTFPQEIHPLKMKMCHIWRYLRQSAKSVHIGF